MLRSLAFGGSNLNAVDVRVHVYDGCRARETVTESINGGNTGIAGAADSDGYIPSAGARVPVGGNRKRRGRVYRVLRSPAGDEVLDVDGGYGAAVGVFSGDGKGL